MPHPLPSTVQGCWEFHSELREPCLRGTHEPVGETDKSQRRVQGDHTGSRVTVQGRGWVGNEREARSTWGTGQATRVCGLKGSRGTFQGNQPVRRSNAKGTRGHGTCLTMRQVPFFWTVVRRAGRMQELDPEATFSEKEFGLHPDGKKELPGRGVTGSDLNLRMPSCW